MPTLSEADSKGRLAPYGVPLVAERAAVSADDAVRAAEGIGYPVVAKLCGERIAHKTERGLVRLELRDAEAVRNAVRELLEAARPEDGDVRVLIAPMLRGNRELIAGVVRDPQFGPCVMLGIGGVLAEAVSDVAFRLVPIDDADAHEMIDELRMQELLGPFRDEPGVDREALAGVVLGLSRLAAAETDVVSVDVNPLIVVDGRPIAADALVEIAEDPAEAQPS